MYNVDTVVGARSIKSAGKAFETVNPARPEEVVGKYNWLSPTSLSEVVAQARSAQSEWAAVPDVERGKRVLRFLDAIADRTEDIARSVTLEQGKPLGEARGELSKSIQEARFMVGEAARAHSGVIPPARTGVRAFVTRRPRGVIAAITPWNFPTLTPMRKIAPALVFGNAIVLKPSEYTPAAACLMAQAADGILPVGLFQVVLGGAEVGSALVREPRIAGVTFTGSVATGKKVFALAAENLAEISLELGGKNAAVVNDVDDLDTCLDQIAAAAFLCGGQRCTAISRVLVATSLSQAVVDGLVSRAKRVVLGDGMAESTTMGPLVNATQLERVEGLVTTGVREGADVAVGGSRARVRGLESGYFYQPTILAGVSPEMSVAQEEIFGPVITVTEYESFDRALEILNGVSYGLTSALFSNDNRVIQRFIDRSENGMMHINHGTAPDENMPFGGIKNSGVGAFSVGTSAVNFYTTEHSVYLKY